MRYVIAPLFGLILAPGLLIFKYLSWLIVSLPAIFKALTLKFIDSQVLTRAPIIALCIYAPFLLLGAISFWALAVTSTLLSSPADLLRSIWYGFTRLKINNNSFLELEIEKILEDGVNESIRLVLKLPFLREVEREENEIPPVIAPVPQPLPVVPPRPPMITVPVRAFVNNEPQIRQFSIPVNLPPVPPAAPLIRYGIVNINPAPVPQLTREELDSAAQIVMSYEARYKAGNNLSTEILQLKRHIERYKDLFQYLLIIKEELNKPDWQDNDDSPIQDQMLAIPISKPILFSKQEYINGRWRCVPGSTYSTDEDNLSIYFGSKIMPVHPLTRERVNTPTVFTRWVSHRLSADSCNSQELNDLAEDIRHIINKVESKPGAALAENPLTNLSIYSYRPSTTSSSSLNSNPIYNL